MSGRAGGLVISLDFELAWGVLDTLGPEGAYRANLLGAREAIPKILELFVEFEVAATWATVGFLFAESREELLAYHPAVRPRYLVRRFDSYSEPVGESERDDPVRFAPSLIRAIATTPRQRIGTHTYSHFYCLEAGQTAEAFDADLGSAVAIAAARGVQLRSIVFPRHQVRGDYLPLLRGHGIHVYRGNESNYLDRPAPAPGGSLAVRLARRGDAYLNLTGTNEVPWAATRPDNGLVNVPASRFLRPYEPRLQFFERLKLARLMRGMRLAAANGSLFHVWWHPHNMGANTPENLLGLRQVLEWYAKLRDEFGFSSYTMEDVAELALKG